MLAAPVFLTARGEDKEPAPINVISWLAGSWKGKAFGGEAEEIWTSPEGGAMMGMFRLIKNGKVEFLEFEQIIERGGSLVFEVKHFTPVFIGWEEKDKCIEFPLVSSNDKEVNFQGLRIIKIDDNTCKHIITLKDKATGKAKDQEIIYYRAQLSSRWHLGLERIPHFFSSGEYAFAVPAISSGGSPGPTIRVQ